MNYRLDTPHDGTALCEALFEYSELERLSDSNQGLFAVSLSSTLQLARKGDFSMQCADLAVIFILPAASPCGTCMSKVHIDLES